MSRRRRWRPQQWLAYIGLLFACVVTIIPIYWMVATSLRSLPEIYRFPPHFLLRSVHFDNYIQALHQVPFMLYLRNSGFLALCNVTADVLSALVVGYGFAKLRWRGRQALFTIMLATIFLPGTVTLAPTYIIFHDIGWTGTYLPLIVPPFFATAFNVFLMRQFMRGIPDSILEAARIDGASEWSILCRIVAPLSYPAIGSVAILSFMGSWDNFLAPLVYLDKPSLYTLPLGLQSLMGSKGTLWNQVMAGSVMFMIPMAIVFFVGHRAILHGGIQATGLRG